MFSALNLISGFLETGAIIFGLRYFGIEAALVSALLYQMGNLTPYPITVAEKLTVRAAIVSCILMVLGLWFPICFVLAVPFLSAAVQSVRAGMKTGSSKMRKRLWRILGFLLGFGITPVLGAVCATVTLFCAVRNKRPDETAICLPRFGKLQFIMLFHQMHYFVYCYAVLVIAYQYGGAFLAAGMFFLGWLTYVFAPLLYKSGKDYRKIFLFGHLLLTAILLSLFFIPSLAVKALLWLLTGFGGTTEFCIGNLEKQRGKYSESNHNCAENFGHILGVAVCLVCFVLTGNLFLTVLLSACFAVTAIIAMQSLNTS